MNGVGTVLLGQLDNPGNIQIGAQGALVLADEIGLVGSGSEHAVHVLVGVDGNGLQTQIVAGPENPHGDFAAVGHQHLFERSAHRTPPLMIIVFNYFCPVSILPRICPMQWLKSQFYKIRKSFQFFQRREGVLLSISAGLMSAISGHSIKQGAATEATPCKKQIISGPWNPPHPAAWR